MTRRPVETIKNLYTFVPSTRGIGMYGYALALLAVLLALGAW